MGKQRCETEHNSEAVPATLPCSNCRRALREHTVGLLHLLPAPKLRAWGCCGAPRPRQCPWYILVPCRGEAPLHTSSPCCCLHPDPCILLSPRGRFWCTSQKQTAVQCGQESRLRDWEDCAHRVQGNVSKRVGFGYRDGYSCAPLPSDLWSTKLLAVENFVGNFAYVAHEEGKRAIPVLILVLPKQGW